MTRGWKLAIAGAVCLILAGGAALWLRRPWNAPTNEPAITLEGAVLRQDTDPKKQTPIPDADVAVGSGPLEADAKSDSSGFFKVPLNPAIKAGETVSIRVRHAEYEPLEMYEAAGEKLYIARLTPTAKTPPSPTHPGTVISNVRVRYAEKTPQIMNMGIVVQTLEAVNTGNTPCAGAPTCSPDGRWKATISNATVDAGERNELRNVRVSCIAGPCPFTKIESPLPTQPRRVLHVSVRNWSDTATFLIEAEVSRTMVSNLIREAYPVIFGQAMTFTLPATAEGPSIGAEINTTDIIFPLGPALILSWARCTEKVEPDHSRLFSCELKPGFTFKSSETQ
ncbi:MAG: hypothetical protein JO033_05585 [Acidobacteriaceae bacterium]|nr:hypothetical protein [Acidobacteriaceae bacterium]